MKRHPSPVLAATALLCLVLAATAAARDTSSTRKNPGPQRTLILNGSPVHDVGNLWVHASNWGAIGSMPGSGAPYAGAPSAQWPGGSNVEYLDIAGLWVGGQVGGVPMVTTAAVDAEFRPVEDPRDIVYDSAFGTIGGKRIPSLMADDDGDGLIDEDRLDGYDNDGDGLIDEDYAAISDQMLSRVFRDDTPEALQIPQHTPLHLAVREESCQFSDSDYDDFVGFTFWITNDGAQPITHAYIAIFALPRARPRDAAEWNDVSIELDRDITVDLGAHGVQTYDFVHWYNYMEDTEAPGDCGFLVLDHPVDPSGATAPTQPGVVTFRIFSPAASFEDGGAPTNDFERYELLASETIQRSPVVPRDYEMVFALGPFNIAPGQTVPFSFALVATPRGDFSNVQRAAQAYHGLWFDLDNDPSTGIDGKEHPEHWYLPGQNPVPVAITHFDARAENGSVLLAWETWTDAGITGFEILRAAGSGDLRVLDGAIAADRSDYVDRAVAPGTRYEYQLVARGADGWTAVSPRVSAVVPRAELALRPNTPNPFADATTVSFALPERMPVTLAVYDVAGRRVATLYSGVQSAGDHDVQWSGLGDDGQRVGAGIYFCRIEAGAASATRKMLVIR